MDDDQVCPRCRTTKYRNPSLKLLVNICGHALCENCVDLLFVKGSGSCPECGVALRRGNFRVQLFEDASVEKEVDIRKKILKDYNKREEDFTSLNDYNDYLEEIETIVFNLMNNIDVEATKKKVEAYKKENRDEIAKNRFKVSGHDHELEMILEEEIEFSERRQKELEEERLNEKIRKQKDKDSLIDELMFSTGDARTIVAMHNNKRQMEQQQLIKRPKQATRFSSGIKIGLKRTDFLPVPKEEEVELYCYQEPEQKIDGPDLPTYPELVATGYFTHIRKVETFELASGFTELIACSRALQDAMCGLFYVPKGSSEDMDVT